MHKKSYFVLVLLSLLCTPIISYSYKGYFKLSAFASVGYTGGNKVYVGSGSLLNYRFHVKPTYKFHKYISMGLDVFYLHAYSTRYNAPVPYDSYSRYGSLDYIGTLVISNFEFFDELFLFGLGVGTYIGIGDNLGRVDFGFMFSFGLDIPLSDNFSLPIVNRYDFIFSERFLAPINIMIGVSYRFR